MHQLSRTFFFFFCCCCIQDIEATTVSGNGTETGQIITTTIAGRDGQPKQVITSLSLSLQLHLLIQTFCLPCLRSKHNLNF